MEKGKHIGVHIAVEVSLLPVRNDSTPIFKKIAKLINKIILRVGLYLNTLQDEFPLDFEQNLVDIKFYFWVGSAHTDMKDDILCTDCHQSCQQIVYLHGSNFVVTFLLQVSKVMSEGRLKNNK